MKNSTPEIQSPRIPEGASEEFAAAVEAATGLSCVPEPIKIDGWRGVRLFLDQILMAPRPDRGLEVLARSRLLFDVLPEVAALVGFGEGIVHKDVWAHTKQVVRQTPAHLIVRWAGLLHDIGKVPTRRFESGGQVTFIGHPEVGARMFDRMCHRLPFEPPEAERLRLLIAVHLRAAAYAETWTDSAVRRFARDVGENLDDLLDLARADITSKYAEKVRRGLRQIELLEQRITQVKELDSKPALLPTGLGTELIRRFSSVPGPGLGRMVDRLKADVEDGKIEAQREFDYYLDYVARHPDMIALLGSHRKTAGKLNDKR